MNAAQVGRGQNQWALKVQVNSAVLRGEVARLKAGSGPLARQVVSASSNSEGKARKILLGMFGCAMLVAVCACGGGVAAFVFRYWEQLFG